MKHLHATGGALLLLCRLSFSSVSNVSIPQEGAFLPTDSISYTYQSTRDTVISRIYLETGEETSGLSEENDVLLFTITMIDNNQEEKWGVDKGLMADGDPDDGAFLFSPGQSGLAPGHYILALTDDDGTVTENFQITAPTTPYRTVSGTVVPPDGADAQFISVRMEGKDIDYTLSAFTDESGNYEIAVDQETFNACGGMVRIGIESRFTGYIPEPTGHELEINEGDKSDVDFTFVAATCAVKGAVLADGEPLTDVRVGLSDENYDQRAGTATDENGLFIIYCTPGIYFVQVDVGGEDGYFHPKEMKVEVLEGDTEEVEITVPVADAYVYGRVTVKDAAPSESIAMYAHNDEVGGNRANTDAEGYFKIPVIGSVDSYGVGFKNSDDGPLYEDKIIEGGHDWVDVGVGDTAYFNFIDKPAGGIAGTLTNSTDASHRYFYVRVYGSDNGESYQFQTETDGAYTFDGIPEGTWYAEAGMSVQGEDEFNWKSYAYYAGDNGEKKAIVIGGDVVDGIDFEFNQLNAGQDSGSYQEVKGDGVLNLTVNNETGTTFEKGMVMLFDDLPDGTEDIMPLRNYELQGTGTRVALTEVPNQSVYVVVELVGSAGDSMRYFMNAVVGDDGKPAALDFASQNEQTADVTLTDEDQHGMPVDGDPVMPVGNGKISGTVIYNGDLPTDKMYVLLHDEKEGDMIRDVEVVSGKYVIENVQVGVFRVVAVIDVDGDKEPEAFAISDEVITITGDEVYENVDLEFVEKETGTGSISGTLSAMNDIPSEVKVVVAAIPIDTTKEDTEQLNEMAFMMAYQAKLDAIGDYSVEDLPDGVYYMVSMAEAPDGDEMHEVALGVYGELKLTVTDGGLPFDPKPVVVKDGNAVGDIDFIMIAHTKEEEGIAVTTPNSSLPAVFSMKLPRVNAIDGLITMQFALPKQTVAQFAIMDLRGRIVARLHAQQFAAGYHTVKWNISEVRVNVAAGTFILSMQSAQYGARHIIRLVR